MSHATGNWNYWPHADWYRTFLVVQRVKHLPAMQDTRVWSPGREDPLEKEMETHSSTLAWKSPWMEEPGRLPSMQLQKVRHDWATPPADRCRQWRCKGISKKANGRKKKKKTVKRFRIWRPYLVVKVKSFLKLYSGLHECSWLYNNFYISEPFLLVFLDTAGHNYEIKLI